MDSQVSLKIRQLIRDVHLRCFGFRISTHRGMLEYVKFLLRYLLEKSRSPSVHPRMKRKYRLYLFGLSIAMGSAMFGSCYTLLHVYQKIRNAFDIKKRPNLVRTRSQRDLHDGARIMYIPEDPLFAKDTHNNDELSPRSSTKKIYIKPKNESRYEHDKYLFKTAVELEKNSPLFHSRFLIQMQILTKILIPSLLDKNSLLLAGQIFFLVMRTWLSLYVAKLDGKIVRDIIAVRSDRFMIDMMHWFLLALPASYTNSAIKLLQKKLSLNFRANLTRYIHDMYLDKRLAFYKLIFDSDCNDSVVRNIDNSITNDVTNFCEATTSIFANMAKPMIDLIFFSVYLRDNLGSFGVAGIFINYFITGFILRKYTPPLGKLASRKSTADGNYYNYLLNMINNHEEIAFYQGTNVESEKVRQLYGDLMNKSLLVDRVKFKYNMVEDYILKYTWSGLGYVFASIPIVLSTLTTGINSEQHNMKEFIVNKRLMLSLADAGSRLMHSIKEISQLTGYTNRIFTLLIVLHRAHSTEFNYGAIREAVNSEQDRVSLNKPDISIGEPNSELEEFIRGTVQNNFNGLRLENIDIIIPSAKAIKGTKLIDKLTFQLPMITSHGRLNLDVTNFNGQQDSNTMLPISNEPSSSLLILGPNGCGKSAIQRVIAGIWPIYNKKGLLSRPSASNIFCIPQRPYFAKGGTFRDQIIYPMSTDEFFDRGYKNGILVNILKEVHLEYLLERSHGLSYFDTVQDWRDVLSGGEKQRMNYARILFHRPAYVILDEATNAISIDMEDYLFNVLKKFRFNYVTISQRPSLIKYHDMLLEITGKEGKWNLQTIGTDEAIMTIEHEIEELQEKLKHVEEWEKERELLLKELSVN